MIPQTTTPAGEVLARLLPIIKTILAFPLREHMTADALGNLSFEGKRAVITQPIIDALRECMEPMKAALFAEELEALGLPQFAGFFVIPTEADPQKFWAGCIELGVTSYITDDDGTMIEAQFEGVEGKFSGMTLYRKVFDSTLAAVNACRVSDGLAADVLGHRYDERSDQQS